MGVSFGFRQICVMLAMAPAPARAIVGGQVGGPLEASAVMVLHDRGGVCTGSVIAPEVILTAAHCVPPGTQVRVHFREQGQPVLLEPQSIVRHPEYRADAVRERTRSIDMALIRLNAALPTRFEPAMLADSPAGGAITVAGFGLAREGDAATTGTWRSARLQVTEPYGPSRILLWAKAEPGIGACQGDSGGPIIGTGGAVVAVTSWSTGRSAGRCGDLTQGVLVGAQRRWIDATLGQWRRQAEWR